MKPTHETENHELFLHELLELADPLAGLRASERAQCGDCQRQLTQLVQLRLELDQAAAEQRIGLREAASAAGAQSSAYVEAALGSATAARKPRPRRTGAWVVLASIAAILMLMFWIDSSSKSIDPLTPMGESGPAGILTPRSREDARTVFRWEPNRGQSPIYQVHVYNAEGDQIEIGTSPMIQGSCEWLPTPGEIDWDGVRTYFWVVDVSNVTPANHSTSYESDPIDL